MPMADEADGSCQYRQASTRRRARADAPASTRHTTGATANTAAGIRMLARGMTSTFAGSDMVVVRWKYHAIGRASETSMMAEIRISSEAARTNPAPRSKTKFDTSETDDLRQVLAHQPQIGAELRRPRRQAEVVGWRIDVAQRSLKWVQRALQDRHRNSGDGDHRKKRQLEAGLEERARRDNQDAQRRNAQRVESVAVAEEQAREQVDGQRDGRAHDGRPEIGEKGIAPREQDGQHRGRLLAHGQSAQEPRRMRRRGFRR